eukprot:m51a1_g14784 putative acyltransferase (147) ;mRNA; f:463640-471192
MVEQVVVVVVEQNSSEHPYKSAGEDSNRNALGIPAHGTTAAATPKNPEVPETRKGQPKQGERRVDIQVMRALAVTVVVLFHLDVPWMRGGFVGVDIFFVISGFLVFGSVAAAQRDDGEVNGWTATDYSSRLELWSSLSAVQMIEDK